MTLYIILNSFNNTYIMFNSLIILNNNCCIVINSLMLIHNESNEHEVIKTFQREFPNENPPYLTLYVAVTQFTICKLRHCYVKS